MPRPRPCSCSSNVYVGVAQCVFTAVSNISICSNHHETEETDLHSPPSPRSAGSQISRFCSTPIASEEALRITSCPSATRDILRRQLSQLRVICRVPDELNCNIKVSKLEGGEI